jgi:UDP-2-acetamido-3-amino-2,3-dideoxy-glucuronate N-acetyltransferase
MTDEAPRIHPLACVDPGARIGARTQVWQFVVILDGAVIGEDCNLNAHVLVEGGAFVGDRVTLKSGVFVWDGVTLGDDVFVGPNAVFTNDKTPRSRKRPATWRATVVGRGASIGGGAIILPGITIGEGAMIGGGAVVTRDVPTGETWIGNPARRLGQP